MCIIKVRWIKVATELLKVNVEYVFGWSVAEVHWGFFRFGGCVGSGGEGGGCRCGKQRSWKYQECEDENLMT